MKTLNEVCKELFAGGDVPKDRSSKFITEEYNIPIFSNGAKNDGLYGYTDIPRVKDPSITVSARGTIGYSSVRIKPYLPVVRLIVLIPDKELITLHFLKYVIESMDFSNSGTSIPQLTVPMIKKYNCSIPPLEEQKQIVEILDNVFKAIDQAKANIEKNIENAKELFQSKLNDIFSQKGEGWEEKKIEEVSKVVNGYSFKSKDFSAENEIKSIKITNVSIMEFVEDLSNNLPNSFLNEYSKVRVNEGDLVLALTRTIISGGLKVARVPESYHNSLLNQRVAAIVANTDLVDSDYLYYYFSSNIVYNYVLDNVNTLMQPNLSIGDLKKMPVPITSIKGQKIISNQIEDLSKKTNSLVSNYENKLNDLEELKKSILQKAFAGELTQKEVVV